MPAQMIDKSIQTYLKDATRPVEVKIFCATITCFPSGGNTGKIIQHYFTSRFEIGYTKTKGTSSVYDKLERVRNILNSTNETECEQNHRRQQGNFVDGI
jgi:hypothetical protein